jgi:hypothetical protein
MAGERVSVEQFADWRQRAACRQSEAPPDTWFPDQGDPATRDLALRICRDCPVIRECGQFGFLEPWGIWGGMSQKRRSSLRGTRAIDVAHEAMRGQHLQPCGTLAAYSRHYRNGEKPCDECRRANARATSDKAAKR